ncbi:Peptidase M15A, C-terminal [uncultured Caudovirales phage]|uniref:Peptidase M15A, C-terminal n=1 Tax=uncultured Caudovirales phage TaxID=2100421 RepID=A0A6J5N5V3_9CAUD|nr:Peptidase M15A, C-terminal [uncultured Caudovirales phage]
MENISKHITFEEATNSPTAQRLNIDNRPNELQLYNMKQVAANCFEPLREWYNKPIKINSFLRVKALNIAIKGAKNSQHETGEAIDLSAGSSEENKKLYNWCKANLVYDQLINEFDYTWVHISFSALGNRNMTLKATKNTKGQTIYS